MASIIPQDNNCSVLWKSSGNFSPMVCSITRLPAKPIKALGSARIMSPKNAKLADTPPVVGSVKQVMTSSLLCWIWLAVLAICTKAFIPSCIRAPPLVQTINKGICFFWLNSTAQVIFSPTTIDMLPIMKCESMTASTNGWFSIFPVPQITASSIPVERLAFSSFSS